MPNFAQALPESLFTLLFTAANAFVALVTFYILKYIFELVFFCTCSPGINSYDIMYMCAPPFILFLLVFIIDKHKHKLLCGDQSLENKHCNRCSFVVEQFLRLLLTGLFWMAAVFLDGDWYECYKANNEGYIACKNTTAMIEKVELKTHFRQESLIIGLSLIMGGVGLWALWSCCLMNCCQPYYHKLYQNYLSAETEAHLTEELKKLAQERAQIICREHLKIIREKETPPSNIEQRSGPTDGQLTSDGNVGCCSAVCSKLKKTSDCCTERQTASWHTISGMFFHQSGITESSDVSLFNRHLQKDIEADVERQIQELVKERAAVITEARVRKLREALQTDVLPQIPPDEALSKIDEQCQKVKKNAPPNEGNRSAQSSPFNIQKGQEAKAENTESFEMCNLIGVDDSQSLLNFKNT